jgi:hypothetical protein
MSLSSLTFSLNPPYMPILFTLTNVATLPTATTIATMTKLVDPISSYIAESEFSRNGYFRLRLRRQLLDPHHRAVLVVEVAPIVPDACKSITSRRRTTLYRG